MEDYKGVIEDSTKVINLDNERKEFDLGKYEEAIASYDRVLYYKPDHYRAWFIRAVALSNLGKYEEAIASYDKGLHYKPDDYDAWYNKACIYGLQGDVPLAVKNFKQAIKLNPKYKDRANSDKDFDLIREHPEFQQLF